MNYMRNLLPKMIGIYLIYRTAHTTQPNGTAAPAFPGRFQAGYSILYWPLATTLLGQKKNRQIA